MSILVPARREVAQKAMTGAYVGALSYGIPLSALNATPQKMASEAQALYHTHLTIRAAEMAVSGRGSNVAYHLEDGDDNAIDDESGPNYQVVRDLIEKPQANLPPEQRQPAIQTRRGLWRLTMRHMGLCGTAFWYLDQMDGLGLPLSVMYINPARMYPAEDKAGNLLGWSLDYPADDRRGTPLELSEVLPFYLDPPDYGHFGIGLVESAYLKAQLETRADRHSLDLFASGGRISGAFSPKEGVTINEDEWKAIVRDWRTVTEDPNATKRLQIIAKPFDYTRLGANQQELATVDVSRMAHESLYELWGVPPSQVGREGKAGLNSGAKQGFDEAVIWQGAIHDRLMPLYETIQYGLLDRFKNAGTVVELVIEEPEFDDETPQFALVSESQPLAMTNNERRALVGRDPLPDYASDGTPLGLAIYMVNTMALVGAGAPEGSDVAPALPAAPAPPPVIVAAPQPLLGPGEQPPSKATLRKPFLNLRADVDAKVVPATKRSVAALLALQKSDITDRIRAKFVHLRSKPSDTAAWWSGSHWDKALAAALEPHVSTIARMVGTGVEKRLSAKKATPDPFLTNVTKKVLDRGAARVTGINQTTKDAVVASIMDGIDAEDDLDALINRVANLSVFDSYRSEMIARTETADAYNAAALASYGEFGVSQVEAIDGDEDTECAERDGQVFSVEEADAIEDHPNGTLDWAPIVDFPEPAKASPLALTINNPGPLTRTVVERDPLTNRVVAFRDEPIYG